MVQAKRTVLGWHALAAVALHAESFSLQPPRCMYQGGRATPSSTFRFRLLDATDSVDADDVAAMTEDTDADADLPAITNMRLKEIQQELRDLGTSYTDCFDRESLVKKLTQARENKANNNAEDNATEKVKEEEGTKATTSEINTENETVKQKVETSRIKDPAADAATSAALEEKLKGLRSMRVRQLREECAKRQIRWANFVEKEDLVQAIYTHVKASSGFSVSGAISPGEVATLTGEQFEIELQSGDTPILLDVYATWCGPCQMMAPQLALAAEEFGTKARVVKIDSDKYPEIAQKYRVGGLPTLIVLKDGKEAKRIEGSVMKDGLVTLMSDFIEP